MAAINVTSGDGDTHTIKQGARAVVRLSNGRPYVIVENSSDDQIQVWKGNATTPASFSEPDAGNGPTGTVWGSCSAAVDINNVIHIAYCTDEGKASQLRYVQFASDVFLNDTQIIADLGGDPTAITNLQTAIAIDSNNKPHIAFIATPTSGATIVFTVKYINNIDAAWNSGVSYEVEGVTNVKQCAYPDITIDAGNLPVISYSNETDDDVGVAIGDKNDAESFTLQDVDADLETTSGQNRTSICVDSDGNYYVAYRDESDTFIYLIKHDKLTFYASKSYNETEEGSPRALAFSSDGSKMYVLGTDGDTIYQYTLATPWDVSTASYANKSYNATEESYPQGLAFSSDGSKMYIIGETDDTIYQYTLTTPWDVSTASYASKSYNATEEGTPGTLAFSSDGSKMYVIGIVNDTVYQYTLTTPWDVSTASYASKSYNATEEGSPSGLAFSSDGSKMYIIGTNNDTIYQYTLTTSWDISTASYASKNHNEKEEGSPRALAFSSDGSKMYVLGTDGDTIYQYTLAAAWDLGKLWSTWETRATGSDEGMNPSLATDGTAIYIFYENADKDIIYEKVTGGSSWQGNVTLETGDYNTVKAKWAYAVDRDSGGTDRGGSSGRVEIDYAFTDETATPDILFNSLSLAVAGWTGKILGVTNPAKIMGVAVANISKVMGV